ncbi:MAG: hypothetical protein HOH43_17800 [Candidatus Latescibacteria bacterium]|jgi:hypothetical protein|nr:hypothetical protein [Candidatus Latescibacterota bacterium]
MSADSKPTFRPFRNLNWQDQVSTAWTIFQLQARLVFSQRFVWFISGILLYIGIIYAMNYQQTVRDRLDYEDLYMVLMTMPLLILTVYVNMQVIVNEKDQGTLEVMFTTAGSRYKVWLLRLGALNVLLFFVTLALSAVVFFTFADFSILGMACNVFATIFLVGNLTLYVAILLRSSLGAGMVTGVFIMLHSMIIGIMSDIGERSSRFEMQRYFLFFNPYDVPEQFDPVTWDLMMWQNRTGAMILGLVFIFFAIRGMDNRDRLLQ